MSLCETILEMIKSILRNIPFSGFKGRIEADRQGSEGVCEPSSQSLTFTTRTSLSMLLRLTPIPKEHIPTC